MESIGIRDRIVIQHRAGEQSNRRTIPIEFVILVIASRAGAKIGEVVHEFDGAIHFTLNQRLPIRIRGTMPSCGASQWLSRMRSSAGGTVASTGS